MMYQRSNPGQNKRKSVIIKEKKQTNLIDDNLLNIEK